MQLLGPDDPPPFTVHNENGKAPLLLLCDHASKAVPKALKRAGMQLNDVKLIEFNEAFAAQVVAVVRELEMPEEIVNVNGGAIALGHPLGASGAKLTTQLVHELGKRGGGIGLVTMCVGGGMGAAGLFEVYPN